MKTMKKMSAGLLSLTMVLSMVAGNGLTVSAATKVEKEETVYVNQKADGTVYNITVSDWLKNVSGKGEVLDCSNLSNIQNVKGNETFKQEDGKLIWESKGSDIYYQGKTNEKLPIGVKISYELDGKAMDSSELAGKSGRMAMIIQYKNDCILEDQIDVPFMMTSAIILPVDKFSNVNISQGKLISEGSNQILLAYGMPGISKSLKLSEDLRKEMDKKLSDTVIITADVKDFSMESIYTVASADVLKEIELSDDSDINDLENAVNDLVNATDDLISGSDKLSDGLSSLKKNFKEYAGGVKDINKGATDLKSGAGALATGVSQYTSGVKQLTDGTGQYITGVNQLAEGVNTYVEGEKLIDEGAKTLSNGAFAFYKDTFSPFSTGLSEFFGAVCGENGLSEKTSEFDAAINSDNGEVAKGFGGSNAYMEAAKAQCLGSIEALKGLKASDNLTEEQQTAIDSVIASLEGASNAAEGAKQLNGALKTQMGTATAELNKGVQALSENAKNLDGYNKQIAVGLKEQLIGGITNLYAGIQELSANNSTLKEGAETLKESSSTLTTGITELEKNSTILVGSVNKLKKGAADLSKGADKLNNATKKVGKGVSELKDGSIELVNGIHQFKDEGTGKLQSEYNSNVKNVIDRFKSLIDSAEEYRSFSGIADGMEGKVKFVFQTEEISTEEN